MAERCSRIGLKRLLGLIHPKAQEQMWCTGEASNLQILRRRPGLFQHHLNHLLELLEEKVPEPEFAERIDKALDIARDYGSIDGAHHKAWVIDQMVRALTGDRYKAFIAYCTGGEDGPDTYLWDEGIAP